MSKRRRDTKWLDQLRAEAIALVNKSNSKFRPERQVSIKSALTVVDRNLAHTRNASQEVRTFSALRALSSFISLSTIAKTSVSSLENADLLPVGHPFSTAPHAMSVSGYRSARAQWIAADPLIDDSMRSLVAAAHSLEPGSIERQHAFARLATAGPKLVPITAAIDIGDDDIINSYTPTPLVAGLLSFVGGNSRAARSMRAKLQRRDRYGRFAFMGGGFSFKMKMGDGSFRSFSGRVVGRGTEADADSGLVEVELMRGSNGINVAGQIVKVPANKGTAVKAIIPQEGLEGLPDQGEVQPDDVFVSAAQMIQSKTGAPDGWKPVKKAKDSSGNEYTTQWESPDGYVVNGVGEYSHSNDYENVGRGSAGWATRRQPQLQPARSELDFVDFPAVDTWAEVEDLLSRDQSDYEADLKKYNSLDGDDAAQKEWVADQEAKGRKNAADKPQILREESDAFAEQLQDAVGDDKGIRFKAKGEDVTLKPTEVTDTSVKGTDENGEEREVNIADIESMSEEADVAEPKKAPAAAEGGKGGEPPKIYKSSVSGPLEPGESGPGWSSEVSELRGNTPTGWNHTPTVGRDTHSVTETFDYPMFGDKSKKVRSYSAWRLGNFWGLRGGSKPVGGGATWADAMAAIEADMPETEKLIAERDEEKRKREAATLVPLGAPGEPGEKNPVAGLTELRNVKVPKGSVRMSDGSQTIFLDPEDGDAIYEAKRDGFREVSSGSTGGVKSVQVPKYRPSTGVTRDLLPFEMQEQVENAIREAFSKGDNIRFKYGAKEVVLQPSKLYTNNKNGNRNVTGWSVTDGDERTYNVAKITAPTPKLPSSQSEADKADAVENVRWDSKNGVYTDTDGNPLDAGKVDDYGLDSTLRDAPESGIQPLDNSVIDFNSYTDPLPDLNQRRVQMAMDKGQQLRVNYKGKDRTIDPQRLWVNPKTGKEIVTALDMSDGGKEKNFFVSELAAPSKPESQVKEPIRVLMTEEENAKAQDVADEFREKLASDPEFEKFVEESPQGAGTQKLIDEFESKEGAPVDLTSVDQDGLRQAIEDAIANKKDVSFVYHEKPRVVTPIEITINPKNNRPKLRAFEYAADAEKEFFLDKFAKPVDEKLKQAQLDEIVNLPQEELDQLVDALWPAPATQPVVQPEARAKEAGLQEIDTKGSTAVGRAAYDPQSRELFVQFASKDGKGGGVYKYADVPQDFVDRFAASDSLGKMIPELKKIGKSEKIDEFPAVAPVAQLRSDLEYSRDAAREFFTALSKAIQTYNLDFEDLFGLGAKEEVERGDRGLARSAIEQFDEALELIAPVFTTPMPQSEIDAAVSQFFTKYKKAKKVWVRSLGEAYDFSRTGQESPFIEDYEYDKDLAEAFKSDPSTLIEGMRQGPRKFVFDIGYAEDPEETIKRLTEDYGFTAELTGSDWHGGYPEVEVTVEDSAVADTDLMNMLGLTPEDFYSALATGDQILYGYRVDLPDFYDKDGEDYIQNQRQVDLWRSERKVQAEARFVEPGVVRFFGSAEDIRDAITIAAGKDRVDEFMSKAYRDSARDEVTTAVPGDVDDSTTVEAFDNVSQFSEEKFDELFPEVAEGYFKVNTIDTYIPRGAGAGQEVESSDYTDDPHILSNKFTPNALLLSLKDAISPDEETGAPATGYATLKFDKGGEYLSAEALYAALSLTGMDAEQLLATLYDMGYGGTENTDRAIERQAARVQQSLSLPADEFTESIISLSDAGRSTQNDRMKILNGLLANPKAASQVVRQLENFVESNEKIIEVADRLKWIQDNNPDPDRVNLGSFLDQYLPLATSPVEQDREAFRGIWGMLMSLDGGDSSDFEGLQDDDDHLRSILFKALVREEGSEIAAQDAYEELVAMYGGFPEFVLGRQKIADGDDDLNSKTTAAAFSRLVAAAARPNAEKLTRYIGIAKNDPNLSTYLTEGSIFDMDPRSFSSNDVSVKDDSRNQGSDKLYFIIEPGQGSSISAHMVSPFENEKEHFAYGTYEVISSESSPVRAGSTEQKHVVVLRQVNPNASKPNILDDFEPTEDVIVPDYGDISSWKQYAPAGGSNIGGYYRDAQGNKYYLKEGQSQSHVDNETLATAFYRELGIPVPLQGYGMMNGELWLVSPIVSKENNFRKLLRDKDFMDEVRQGFAVDAWLSNYDVTGWEYDNIIPGNDGAPVRIDNGGALMWRARGEEKLWFGDDPTEIDSMRDPDEARVPASADVFGSMTEEDVARSARRLLDISPSRIARMVKSAVKDPEEANELAQILIARRENILSRYGLDTVNPDADILGEPTSLATSMGYEARDLQPEDVTAGDSFVIERVFHDADTPKGKVSVEGYFPGHETQRKEWNERTVIDVFRGAPIPPKGDKPALHRPKRPVEPKQPAFTGSAAQLLDGASNWEDVRERLRNTEIVFFDYETTGFPDREKGDFSTNQPVQLGAVRVVNGEVVDRFNMYMNPGEPLGLWSRENLKRDNDVLLTDEWLSEQPGKDDIHRQFVQWAGENAIFGAHNAPFDMKVFNGATEEAGIDYSPAGVIDTLKLSQQFMPSKSQKVKPDPNGPLNHKLPTLSEFFGKTLEGWHSADVDAEAVLRVLNGIIGAINDKPLPDLAKDAQKYANDRENFDRASKEYAQALLDYETAKAVAAAWNCGGGNGFIAAGDEYGDDCNVPSVDEIIRRATPDESDFADPDGIHSGPVDGSSSPLPDRGADDLEDYVIPFPENVDPADLFAGEKFMPTLQQQNIIAAWLTGEDVVVLAKAGTGKTTTLVLGARVIKNLEPGKKLLYIAYNRSVADEARTKFPPNTEVKTSDAVAYSFVRTQYPDLFKKFKSDSALFNKDDIAKFLGLSSVTIGDEKYEAAELASMVQDTIFKFEISADSVLNMGHVYDAGVPQELQDIVFPAARMYWADILNQNGQLPFAFNEMKKLWSMSKPDFSGLDSGVNMPIDVVMLDEAQDTNDAVGSVVLNQSIQVIMVGDPDQAIYQFNGAKDQLQNAVAPYRLPLTESWRYGPEIGGFANRFLALKEKIYGIETNRGIGRGPTGEVVAPGSMEDAEAVIVRSNAGAFKEILEELESNRVVGVTKSFYADLKGFIEATEWLQAGGTSSGKKRPARMPDDLRGFRSWKDVVNEAAKGDNSDLGTKTSILVDIVEEEGIKGLYDMLSKIRQIESVSDAKKSMGDDAGAPRSEFDIPDEVGVGAYGQLTDGISFSVDPVGITITGKKTFPYKEEIKKAGAKWNGDSKVWKIPAKTDDERRAALERLQKRIRELEGFGTPEERAEQGIDVVISTAHQMKGLEFGRVRVGGDFRGPRKDKETEEILWPSVPEFNLAYVTATRAINALDPGSLEWIYDATSEKDESPFPTAESSGDGGTPAGPGEPPTGGPDEGDRFDEEYNAQRAEFVQKVGDYNTFRMDEDEFFDYLNDIIDEGPFNVDEKRELQKAFDEYRSAIDKAQGIEDDDEKSEEIEDARNEFYDKLTGIADGNYPPRPPSGGTPAGPGEPPTGGPSNEPSDDEKAVYDALDVVFYAIQDSADSKGVKDFGAKAGINALTDLRKKLKDIFKENPGLNDLIEEIIGGIERKAFDYPEDGIVEAQKKLPAIFGREVAQEPGTVETSQDDTGNVVTSPDIQPVDEPLTSDQVEEIIGDIPETAATFSLEFVRERFAEVDNLFNEASENMKRPSNKPIVEEVREAVNEILRDLIAGNITIDDAYEKLADVADSVPQFEVNSKNPDAAEIEALADYVLSIRDSIEEAKFGRRLHKDLPPPDLLNKQGQPMGTSKNGIFIRPGMRVRDRNGYAGRVLEYNKGDWIGVFVRMELDTRDPAAVKKGNWGPGVARVVRTASTLDVIGEDEDPWADVRTDAQKEKDKAKGVDPRPPSFDQQLEIYNNMIRRRNEQAWTGEESERSDDDDDGDDDGGGGGVSPTPSGDDGGDSPKAEAPKGAPEAPFEKIENSDAYFADDDLVFPRNNNVDELESFFADTYKATRFIVDPFLNNEVDDHLRYLSGGLIEYQGDRYVDINKILRGQGDTMTPEQRKVAYKAVSKLDRLFSRAPYASSDMVVYRGVSRDYADILKSYDIGDVFIDRGYSSTTLDRDEARVFASTPGEDSSQGVILEIAIDGRGIYVPAFLGGEGDGNDDEREFLLPRGSVFKVVSKGIDADAKTPVIRVAVVDVETEEVLSEEERSEHLGEEISSIADDILVELMSAGGSSDKNVRLNKIWADYLQTFDPDNSHPTGKIIKKITDFLASLGSTYIDMLDEDVVKRLIDEELVKVVPDGTEENRYEVNRLLANVLHGISGFTTGMFSSFGEEQKEKMFDRIEKMALVQVSGDGGGYVGETPAMYSDPATETDVKEFWENIGNIISKPDILANPTKEDAPLFASSAGALLRALSVADRLDGTFTRVLHFMEDINDEAHPLHYMLNEGQEVLFRPTSWMQRDSNTDIDDLEDSGLFQYGLFGKEEGALGDVLFTVTDPYGLNAKPLPNVYGEQEVILTGGRYKVVKVEKKEINGHPYTHFTLEDISREQQDRPVELGKEALTAKEHNALVKELTKSFKENNTLRKIENGYVALTRYRRIESGAINALLRREPRDYVEALEEAHKDTVSEREKSGATLPEDYTKMLNSKSASIVEESTATQEILDEIFDSEPFIGKKMILFRGVTSKYGSQLEEYEVGDQFTDLGFGSTSTSRKIAEEFIRPYKSDEDQNNGVIVEILIDENTRAISPMALINSQIDSGKDLEREILLDRGTTYQVISKTPATSKSPRTIRVAVVSQDRSIQAPEAPEDKEDLARWENAKPVKNPAKFLSRMEDDVKRENSNYSKFVEKYVGQGSDDGYNIDGAIYYMSGGSLDYNPWLAGVDPTAEGTQKKPNKGFDAVVRTLDKMISLFPKTKDDMLVYRGVSGSENSPLIKTISALEVGDIFENPAYTSTSLVEDVADMFMGPGGFMLEIVVPKGSNGLFADPAIGRKFEDKTSYSDPEMFSQLEAEFILPRDTSFRVLSRKGNRIKLVALPKLAESSKPKKVAKPKKDTTKVLYEFSPVENVKKYQDDLGEIYDNALGDDVNEANATAIRLYQEDQTIWLATNDRLRTNKTESRLEDEYGVELSDVEEVVNAFDEEIDKVPGLPKNTLLYRGTRGSLAEKFFSLEVGEEHTDLGFGSTSLEYDTAEMFATVTGGDNGVILEIEAPSGTKAISLAAYFGDEVDSESEIVLARGTTFRVLSKTEATDGKLRTMRVAIVDQVENITPEPVQVDEEAISYNGIENWTKIGGKKGSNPGGTYRDPNGNTYYVKEPRSDLHAQNEALAAALYKELQVPAVEVFLGEENGELRTVSPIVESTGVLGYNPDRNVVEKLQEGFAVDAWLANWDVAGLTFDNVIIDVFGLPVRVDPGGALMWRAQGEPKGKMFGDTAGEIDTLRDEGMAPEASVIFGDMTDEQAKESAKLLLNITPERIDEIVDSIVTDFETAADLKLKLRNRRQGILDRFGLTDADKVAQPIEIVLSEQENEPDNSVKTVTTLGADVSTPNVLIEGRDAAPDHTPRDKELIEKLVAEGPQAMGSQFVENWAKAYEEYDGNDQQAADAALFLYEANIDSIENRAETDEFVQNAVIGILATTMSYIKSAVERERPRLSGELRAWRPSFPTDLVQEGRLNERAFWTDLARYFETPGLIDVEMTPASAFLRVMRAWNGDGWGPKEYDRFLSFNTHKITDDDHPLKYMFTVGQEVVLRPSSWTNAGELTNFEPFVNSRIDGKPEEYEDWDSDQISPLNVGHVVLRVAVDNAYPIEALSRFEEEKESIIPNGRYRVKSVERVNQDLSGEKVGESFVPYTLVTLEVVPLERTKKAAPSEALAEAAKELKVNIDVYYDEALDIDDVEQATNKFSLAKTNHMTASDAVIIKPSDDGELVAVIEREFGPFRGAYALPGGMLDGTETFGEAADREMKEEVGFDAENANMRRELGGVLNSPDWDPRFVNGVSVGAVAYIVPEDTELVAQDDARAAMWIPVEDLANGVYPIAFGHAAWLAEYYKGGILGEKFEVIAEASKERNARLIEKINKVREELGEPTFDKYGNDAPWWGPTPIEPPKQEPEISIEPKRIEWINGARLYVDSDGITVGENIHYNDMYALKNGAIAPPALPFFFSMYEDEITPETGEGYYFARSGKRYWGKYGAAGVLLRRRRDGVGQYEYLLAKRSEYISAGGGKWAWPGGAHKDKASAASPQLTAYEELREELGFYPEGLEPAASHVNYVEPDWTYETLIVDVTDYDSLDELLYLRDGENTEFGWFTDQVIESMNQEDLLHPAVAASIDSVLEASYKNAGYVPPSERKEPEVQVLGTDDQSITPTGRPKVVPKNPLPISASAVEGTYSLMDAIHHVKNSNDVAVSALVDGGDVEDLDVRAAVVVDQAIGEKKISLRFKLTNWAADRLLNPIRIVRVTDKNDVLDPERRQELGLSDDLSEAVITEKKVMPSGIYIDPNNGAIVETDKPALITSYTTQEKRPALYTGSIIRIDDTLGKTGAIYEIVDDAGEEYEMPNYSIPVEQRPYPFEAPAKSYNNMVKIYLPLNASEDQVAAALKAAGIQDVRSGTKEDLDVIAENRLLSLFKSYTDPTENVQNQELRDSLLDSIEKEEGVSVGDIEYRISDTGRIEMLLPEDKAKELAQTLQIERFEHEMSNVRVAMEYYKDNPGVAFGGAAAIPREYAEKRAAKQILETLASNKLLSSMTRMLEGDQSIGLSTDTDIAKGSADYVFTTPERDKRSLSPFADEGDMHNLTSTVFVLSAEKLLRRLDMYGNRDDEFGERRTRQNILSEIDLKGGRAYEAMFKNDVDFGEYLQYVSTAEEIRYEILSTLYASGITTMYGIPVDELFVVHGDVPNRESRAQAIAESAEAIADIEEVQALMGAKMVDFYEYTNVIANMGKAYGEDTWFIPAPHGSKVVGINKPAPGSTVSMYVLEPSGGLYRYSGSSADNITSLHMSSSYARSMVSAGGADAILAILNSDDSGLPKFIKNMYGSKKDNVFKGLKGGKDGISKYDLPSYVPAGVVNHYLSEDTWRESLENFIEWYLKNREVDKIHPLTVLYSWAASNMPIEAREALEKIIDDIAEGLTPMVSSAANTQPPSYVSPLRYIVETGNIIGGIAGLATEYSSGEKTIRTIYSVRRHAVEKDNGTIVIALSIGTDNGTKVFELRESTDLVFDKKTGIGTFSTTSAQYRIQPLESLYAERDIEAKKNRQAK